MARRRAILFALATVAAIGVAATLVVQAQPSDSAVRTGDVARATSDIAKYNTSTPAARAEAAKFPRFGMSQGFQALTLDSAALGTVLDRVKTTGATSIRLDLPWGEVQPDGPETFRFDRVLKVYDQVLAKGFKVLPVTSGVPPWLVQSQATVDLYYSFLYRAGLELIPRGITTIEVWNEVNLELPPGAYTDFVLKPGAAGFRRAGEELKKTVAIVSSGLAPASTGGGTTAPTDFLSGVYTAGGKGYFDAVGLHPYSWPDDPRIVTPYNWMKRAADLYQIMSRNGDQDKKIWATEFGFPTNSGRAASARQCRRPTSTRASRSGARTRGRGRSSSTRSEISRGATPIPSTISGSSASTERASPRSISSSRPSEGDDSCVIAPET
ncbi:hypothetical protein ET445_01525 [Agromyces protaetiae]|uniref:Glycoside hydrolase family 5 domain-containing protein n=1 Tax=Agromyces protaetiae TaxID=2509455 RepID=A0A4P6F8X4_9MICO|nr:hypothetical protein [Agromyces protaetiae]QAY72214.1 hypothetical protein ET445_01525 [Agromyces protaetiae]